MLIGDTGVGKSEFAKRFLGPRHLEANDSPSPVTHVVCRLLPSVKIPKANQHYKREIEIRTLSMAAFQERSQC
jgi:hypothetical protein